MNIKKSAAFFGPSGAGKTTVARGLAEFYGAHVLSFADPVKRELEKELTLPHNALNGTLKYQYRTNLQGYGHSMRENDPDYWVRKLVDEIERRYAFGDRIFFVDDVRYQNEFDTLADMGFTMIRVEGNGNTLTDEQKNHVSENEWKNFIPDFTLPWIEPKIKDWRPSVQQSILQRMSMVYVWLDEETVVWNGAIRAAKSL